MQPTNGGLYVILTQQEKILDAIIITEILNKNHEAVMADPPSCSTGMDKIKNFGILEMGVVAIYIYIYAQEHSRRYPVLREQRLLTNTMHQLYTMIK